MSAPAIIPDHRPAAPWTTGQKIAFRFFFVFLSLQLITENIWGNLFGVSLSIWTLGEKIFVAPCLWLNRHFFHFKYIPASWTTFSLSLHTIRDITYLLLSVLACILWSYFDRKRAGYNKLLYWFSQCLVAVLACFLFAYGIIKLFPVQMSQPTLTDLYKPLGDLSPFELVWTTFGYGRPYQVLGGVLEVFGAVLILFKRTRIAGLLLIVPVMVNIIMINYTYQVGVLITAFYIFLFTLFLLAPYVVKLSRILFTKEQVLLQHDLYIPSNSLSTKLAGAAFVLLVSASFFFSTQYAVNRFQRTERINHSRKYFVVKSYIVNNDTLKFVEKDTSCWRMWSERITDGKKYVTISTMNPDVFKTYLVEKDFAGQILTLHPFRQKDTASLHFNYKIANQREWHLDGSMQQNNIRAILQRVNPDTTMTLLKIKRSVIVFDDEPGVE
jgi:hypothetical protein